jgi:hypothetical protein
MVVREEIQVGKTTHSGQVPFGVQLAQEDGLFLGSYKDLDPAQAIDGK